MPDNELEVIEPNEIEAQPERRQESCLDKILQTEAAYGGAIAQHANELWVRDDETGKWSVQSGTIQQKLLEWFEKGITAPLWDGLLIHLAVDPNNTGDGIYFVKTPGKKWLPTETATNEVWCAKGIYDLRAKSYAPFEKNELVFGPLIDLRPEESILTACRKGDWSSAPAQFRELMSMVDFALGGDADTIRYFRQCVAQCLRPHAGWTHFVHIYGPSGARKTTILRALLSAPCGRNGCSEIAEEVLAEHKFSRIGLVNRVANLSNDSGNSRRFATFIKEVTSGVLMVEKKFHDQAKVKLTAKLFATMNAPQDYTDHSLGVENRLITFRFNERDDNDRGAVGCQWMDASYYSPESRAWITSWLLTGLESLFDDKGHELAPKPSETSLAWKSELLNDASPIRSFVQCEVKVDKKAVTPVQDFIDRAIELRYMEAGDEVFRRELGKHVKARFKIEVSNRRVESKQVQTYCGLALKVLEM